MANFCFACGRKLGKTPQIVDTLEDQAPYVGQECFKRIKAAGRDGWLPPEGGPRLYILTAERREHLRNKGILP